MAEKEILSTRLSAPSTDLVVRLCILALPLYIIWVAHSWNRLRHIPGPLGNALSRWWLLTSQLKGQFHNDLKDLMDNYGDLVRVGPNELVCRDIDAIRKISAAKSRYTRGPWYGTFRFMPEVDHSFSILDEESHAELRNQISPGYAGSTVTEKCISKQVQRLVNLIGRKFLSDKSQHRPVEFASLAHFFAMDVIGEVTFGKEFGFLDEGEDIFGYLKWNEGFFPVMIPAATFAKFAQLLYWWPFTHLFPKHTDKVGLGRFIRAAKLRVEEKFDSEAEKKPRDMMGIFFSQGLTKPQAMAEAVLQVVAGTDSVATSTRMILLYLISSPHAYARLRAEIDEAIAKGRISNPITDAESRALPYFQAVVREGMRMMPGATPPLFKTVPPGGDTLLGFHVPAGTQIGHDVFGTLRSTRYWGPDAAVFRPERWLEADAEALERMNTIFEIQFGFGRYKCLGRPIVFMEVNQSIPELLRRYDFAIINPDMPLKMINAGFWLMKDMWLRITRRTD